MAKKITRHTDLEVYNKAFDVAMRIFELSKKFPKEETYSLTDQIRRASRSVCSNLAEGWRKRRYEAAFISKLSDSEGEAAETQVWLQFAVKCGYAERSDVAVPDSDVKKSLWCARALPYSSAAWSSRGRETNCCRSEAIRARLPAR
jgi:four helix bundle protein